MKRTFLWLFGLLMTVQVMAQNRTITGVVTDASNGEALIGVSVSGKGTSIGTVTDFDGVYSLSVPKDVTTLVFSYVGYTSVEKPVTALKMDVKMTSEATEIDEVVVSAYGINRNKGDVSYANSKVSSDELVTSGSQGALSALQGKVAGVKISKSGGNINSSTRVVVRGESSFSGSNNALIVVDGVVVNNSAFSGGDNTGGSNVDYGNRGNDINPDDIESITLLSGPSATTMYGSAGNGGVLMITTKSGKAAAAAGKKFKVGYNTSFTVETPYILMQRQNKFGQGLWANGGGTVDLGENFSWGPAFDGTVRPWTSPIDLNGETVQLERPFSAIDNQLESFFDLGKTWSNNLSFEGGNDKFAYFAGFNYVDNKGIVPHNWFKRYGFTVNTTANLSDNLTLESSIKYIRTNQRGNVEGASFTTNPAYFSALQTPAGIPFNEIRDYNSPFHDFKGYYGSYTVNPYYFLDNYYNLNDADNIIGSLALKYRPIKGLEVTSRISNNLVLNNTYESVPVYAYADHQVLQDIGGGILAFGNRPRDNNSSIGEYTEVFNKANVLDFNNIAAYTKSWENFKFGVTGGLNITDFSSRSLVGETQGGLINPGFYDLSNSIEVAKASNDISQSRNLRTYGMVDFGIFKALNLNYSFANEWSSTLPEGSRGFFYQSGGISFLASDLFKTPNKWVNYIKLRAGVGTQGRGAPLYALNSIYVASPDYTPAGSYTIQFPFAGVPGFTTGNTIGNPTLTPEKTITYEGGADVEFFENRFNVSYTYYQRINKSLIVTVSLPSSSGFTRTILNIGQMTNKGHELTVGATPLRDVKGLTWNINYTFTKNNNNVDKITDDIDEISLNTGATQVVAKKDYPFGTFKSEQYLKDPNGNIVVNAQGIPVVDPLQAYYGSYQPKYLMGIRSDLSYKGLSFNVLFDISKGGLFYSASKFYADFNGTSVGTLYNDREAWVVPNSVQEVGDGTYAPNTTPIGDVSTYWANASDHVNLIDASYVKLREAGVHYSLPAKVFNNSAISGIKIGFVGYNLKFWVPEENQYADPEGSSFGGNGNVQNFEQASNPTSRSMGVDLKITF